MSEQQRPTSLISRDVFDTFYEGEVGALVEEQMAARDSVRAKQRNIVIVTIIGAALSLIIGLAAASGSDFVMFLPIIVFAGGMAYRGYVGNVFTSKVKASLLPKVLTHYGDFTFGDGDELQNTVRHVVKPILPRHNRLNFDDIMIGTYRGVAVKLVECTAKIKRDKKDRTVFKGVVIDAQLPTGLTGDYWLAPQSHGANLGLNLSNLLGFTNSNHERIKLESPDFERHYDFFGADQIEGRTLMTPRLMECWTTLAKRANRFGIAAQFGPDHVKLRLGQQDDWLDDAIMEADQALKDNFYELIKDIEQLFDLIDVAGFRETHPRTSR